ncbi:hypothetical protein FJQ98_14835 [Lysinibacillus agricola]|uniref:Uncharacterized protein n=1 Tax=Lysinibacillus agricola TaxID=2590012 RepID=A0ABX7AQM7_9BACI|nr:MULTISPECIES: hypothetical protein [Lysinibacillus]KOS63683.1 hypothetical protein AN161_06190 [Lysinibacillus sp. FJAT-14222]QQP10549.1 hypothetical protein FJQ98_14835 [Lysinibacillus agricola]
MKKTLIIISIVLLTLLTACNSSSKVVDDYDTSQLSADFGDNEAYEIGANAKGMPVFKNHKKALQQAQIDYKKGFAATAKEHALKPISQRNYKNYMSYAWQLETNDETVVQQGVMIAKFLDIYENSFEK